MKQFEKVTQSVEALAEFLSPEKKGDNTGCDGCESKIRNWCTGKETCKKLWVDFLNSEVEEPAKDERTKAVTVEISVDTSQMDVAIEKANQLIELLDRARSKIDSLAEKQQD